jgi:hypothetical protein
MSARDRAAGGGPDRAERLCAVCGRRIEWRRKWAAVWGEIRYCSAACRSTGLTATDRRLEETIVTLLEGRGRRASICPSEAARQVAGGDDWRELMEPTRRAARRLAADDRVEITQASRPVDPSTARGPIRIRLSRR